MSEPIGNTKQLAEPVAVRYDFDGYGYMYMDAGSGSDWASRVKNCEFLYTHPMVSKSADMLRQQAEEIELLKADVAGWMDTAIGKTPDEGYWLNLFAKKAREK